MDIDKAVEKAQAAIVVNPTTKSGLIAITTYLTMVIYVLYLHLFVVQISKDSANYLLYGLVLLVPVVSTLLFGSDSIASASNSEATFFQSQFIDAYIAKKFGIDAAKARLVWFRALDRLKDEGFVRRTYQYGYTCRLIYYVKRVAKYFVLLSVLTILAESSYRFFVVPNPGVGTLRHFFDAVRLESNLLGKAVYLTHIIGLWGFLGFGNSADSKKPTGVWRRWVEINDRNRAWVDSLPSLADLEAIATRPLIAEPQAANTGKA